MRPSKRRSDELRDVVIEESFLSHVPGSVLISVGNTKVLCTASI